MASTTSQSSTTPPPSSRQVQKDLIWLFVRGSAVGGAGILVLIVLGIQLTPRQWLLIPVLAPIVTLLAVLPELYLLLRHYRPVGRALEQLGAGRTPAAEEISRAIVRALNLPFYSILRVSLFEGPVVALATFLMLRLSNSLFSAGYETWQIFIAATMIFAFASPIHSVYEFFAVSRSMVPVVEYLSAHGEIRHEDKARLNSTSIRYKLLYLAIFITSLPLVFFVITLFVKIEVLLNQLGVDPSIAQMRDLWLWVGGIVLLCIAGALAVSVLTAAEVSRSAAKLIEAMNEVEKGRLDVKLQVTSTDESARLFRGFNMMVEGLGEEVKILEMSQALMGEIRLDALLEQIIRATTGLLDAERGTLFVYDRKTNELFSRFAEGLKTCAYPRTTGDEKEDLGTPIMRDIRIPADEGIAGAVFTSGKAENISDPYADPRFNPNVDRQTGFRTRSMLTMPIRNKSGERIGVTQVLNKRGGHFTARDESRLKAFTAQIAIALENARLFDDVLSMKNYNENILRSTSNGMMTLDEKGRVATANDATLAILKTERDQILGRPAEEVFGPGNDWVLAAIAKVEATQQTDIAMDADLKLAGGRSASVNLTAVPLIDANQQSIGSMLILEDITSEKRVKSTMSRYMSKEVADQLLESGESILGGKDQKVSILFSDIRNFTNFSESAGAHETVSMLNEYFGEMVDVIFRYGGILDKYIGDAIMALFGAPISRPTDADSAVEAANQMIVILRELNRRRAEIGRSSIDIGIGVSTGNVIVGSIGSPKRMEYTAIGDSVNLASRLEGATKLYGVKILLSEYTVREMKKPAGLREIDLMRVKGKDQPVAVYEALDHHSDESFPHRDEVFDAYRRGMDRYKGRDWLGAAGLFEAALAAHGDDKPSRIYLERCRHYIASPPAPDWNRVWVLNEK